VKATEAGFVCQQQGEICRIKRGKKTVLAGQKQGGLFWLDCRLARTAKDNVAKVDGAIWHQRLGHPGEAALKALTKEKGLKDVEHMHDCDTCAKAKQARETYSPCTSRAEDKMDPLHTDIIGPMELEGLEGEKNVVTLLDDATGFAEAGCLESKGEASGWLIARIRNWERQSGRPAETVRSDRGSEFLGEFARWIKQEGITHQRSAAYTPQQNGRAERLNRTLIEKTRAPLKEHALPKDFWPAAMETAAHLRSHVISRVMAKTGYEAFYGKAADDTDHLRVFGRKAQIAIPPVKRKKLDDVGEVGVFGAVIGPSMKNRKKAIFDY
jgi:transposase InsO family protein